MVDPSMPRPSLVAAYRLQFNHAFTFTRAAELVPYLHDLGISHCYASPYLKARAGSLHGYDIVDHNALNPEIGAREDFERLTAALAGRGMGQILDIVPNHMGVGGNDNQWWLDVLENGQASSYARFFDIDWRPLKELLRGRVLLPVLEDRYGIVLDQGLLKLVFDEARGALRVEYYEHHFPIDPVTYPHVIGYRLGELEGRLDRSDLRFMELQSLLAAFEHLPRRWELAAEKLEERNRDKEIHKYRLAELCAACPAIGRFIQENVAMFNAGNGGGYDRLHDLLEDQAYRLAHWQVASDEINYRRFFDINDLAGLKMERTEVFEATHGLVRELMRGGRLHGLRIDHPDGLYDPRAYYHDLQRWVGGSEPGAGGAGLYVVVEKILATYEHLPENWPVHGTTGYDFVNLVNGLFVDADAERYLTRLYGRFTGQRQSFDELLYESKKFIIKVTLSSELAVLANLLDQLSESDRATRDFTLNGQRDALTEVVACFPVYRTYVTPEAVSEEDRRYVDWAISQAKKRSRAADTSIFDFLRQVLLLEGIGERSPGYREAATNFAMKFQQYTAPVMAKGLEDTAFYRYHRLVSLNEVGGDPRRFGVSVAAFHHANQERLKRWPQGLLCTSTHDTKRSEDVRARIDVLSELPSAWRVRIGRWSRINARRRREVDAAPAPDRNDEYLLYQTLVGVWPLEDVDDQGLGVLRERVEAYMIKAVREAKVHSSWVNVNEEYEAAVLHFVRALLSRVAGNPFLDDFLPFQRQIAHFGMLNSLAQTLLKLTVPGVPDIYQGNELWDLSLVDPDNRRPVDYARRAALLEDLKALREGGPGLALRVAGLMDGWADGRAKLYLMWQVLALRRTAPELFLDGAYLPLECRGRHAAHLCAFVRVRDGQAVLVAVPRLPATLLHGQPDLPRGEALWGDTAVLVPEELPRHWVNRFTGETLPAELPDGQPGLPVTHLFAHFPVCLLGAAD